MQLILGVTDKRLFVDDCVCYREIKEKGDTVKLQTDTERLGARARKLGMRFQTVQRNMVQLIRINAEYTPECAVHQNVDKFKYLGVTITKDLQWNTYVSQICTKSNKTLGFLKRNLYPCPQDLKEAAYKGLVRPVLDCGSSV